MKSNEVFELLVRRKLDNLREVDLGLERGVRLLVEAVARALPLEPFVNLEQVTKVRSIFISTFLNYNLFTLLSLTKIFFHQVIYFLASVKQNMMQENI